MNFKKNKYSIIKNSLSKEIIQVMTGYTLLKRTVYKTFVKNKYIAPLCVDWGKLEDNQANGIYSCYSDILTDTVLQILKPKVEKIIKEKIFPLYSYYRIYTKNDVLPKHLNTKQFYISCLLHIGKNKFPITLNINNEEKTINLNNGDLLIYRGGEVNQTKEMFGDNTAIQIFFYYTNNKDLMWDAKPHPGLPEWFSKNLQWNNYE